MRGVGFLPWQPRTLLELGAIRPEREPPTFRVLEWPDQRLSRPAIEVSIERIESRAFYDLTRGLIRTMRERGALGLSATQVGWAERVFCMMVGNRWTVIVNPRIVIEFGGEVEAMEGCESFPGTHEKMVAPLRLRATFQDVDGYPCDEVFEGDLARCFRHEVEHLDGRTMLDRMGADQRHGFLKRHERAMRRRGSQYPKGTTFVSRGDGLPTEVWSAEMLHERIENRELVLR